MAAKAIVALLVLRLAGQSQADLAALKAPAVSGRRQRQGSGRGEEEPEAVSPGQKLFGGRRRGHAYGHRLFPPITMLQDVMREHIAPGDKGDKNNHHQDRFDIFRRRRINLVGGP